MKNILLVLTTLFVITGCSTLEVDVDYDTAYDFNKTTDYTVVYSNRVGENTLVNDRIKSAIINSLDAKTYNKTSKEQAELVFVFHVNVQDKADIRVDYQMVGYGGYGFARGYGMGYRNSMIATPSTYNYTEGKLIIDALNPITNKIVWRGIATDEIDEKASTPEEKIEYINSVVSQIMSKFPPKSTSK